MTFEERLGDRSLGFVAEPARGSGPTLLAFGGIRGGLGIPPFEFFRVTEGLGVRRIFVRDLDQTWYLRGIRGLGDTPDAAAAALARMTAGERPITTGNSAGGFGAIMLGALLGAERVVAFSPQTAIDRAHRLPWLDMRWLSEMRAVRRLRLPSGQLDLRRLLVAGAPGPAIELHYARSHRRDARHARHLRGVAGVELHRYPAGGHGLVKYLRDSGRLAEIIGRAVSERAPGSDSGPASDDEPDRERDRGDPQQM